MSVAARLIRLGRMRHVLIRCLVSADRHGEEFMSKLRVGIIAGLFGAWAIAVQAADAPGGIPNFSSIDNPWYPVGGVRPPASGVGPVKTITSDTTRRELVGIPGGPLGTTAERPVTLFDVN